MSTVPPSGEEHPTAPSESAQEGPTVPGLIQRIVMTFTAPGSLGERLRIASPWFWTLVPVAVISAAVALLTPADLIIQAAEASAGARGGGQAPNPETIVRLGRIFGVAGSLLGTFVGAAVIAGVLYLVFNVLFGQDLTYKQHLGATAHAFWITLLGGLITFPLMVAQGDINMKLSLGLILSDPTASFLGRFLNGITIFGLWTSGALGAMESGLSGGRVSAGKAATLIIVLYLAFASVTAAFGSLTG